MTFPTEISISEVCPRAVGNICTEDFVHMAHEMGIATGLDLDRLIDAARFAQEILGRPLPGMVLKAGRASGMIRRPFASRSTNLRVFYPPL